MIQEGVGSLNASPVAVIISYHVVDVAGMEEFVVVQ